jgi:serine/threonine protein kinase
VRLLCPACHAPLPALAAGGSTVLTCGACAAEVDASRAGTGAGPPRFVPELDRSGQTVGGFRLGERLGAGGMGTVYRAAARASGAGAAEVEVAVKFLAPALAADADLVARFQREVELLRGLAHPGIVRVLDHGAADGVPWFAMELVAGTDLRARLRSGPLAPAELAVVFARVLTALAHAHAAGIVHRDLKPANVLLGADGAKLADFGIARPPDTGAATRLTETAAIVGTLPYMSPEQRAGHDLDRRSDLFSIGVVLYEAATGRLPIGAFSPASRLNPAYPVAFDRVVERLLRPDPGDRYPNAEAAAVALAAALRPFWSSGRRLGVSLGTAGAIAAGAIVLITRGTGVPESKKLASPPAATAMPAAAAMPEAALPPPANPLPPPPAPAQRTNDGLDVLADPGETGDPGEVKKVKSKKRSKPPKSGKLFELKNQPETAPDRLPTKAARQSAK